MSIEPITRLQRFLRVLADSSADMPEPLRNLEKCCCYACGHLDTRPELHTTLEKLIASVRDKSIVPPKPNTRLEKYVAAMAGVWDDELPEPITREDKILFEAASGEDVTLSGNPLMLENCIGGKALKALHVYGKSTQDGTPTPDAPVPIVSAGDGGSVTVKVTGKNLIQPYEKDTRIAKNGVTMDYNVASQLVHVYGTATGVADIFDTVQMIPLSVKSNVTMSITVRAGKIPDGVIIQYSDFMTLGLSCTGSKPYDTGAFNRPDAPGSVRFAMNIPKGATVDFTIAVQLELGSTATAYSPYHEQLLTLPTPNGLPGIPVTSGGNYTDENGQQWICDEVDLERGVMVQRVWKVQVNTKNSELSEEYRIMLRIDGKKGKPGDFDCIISVTPYVSWTSCVMNNLLYLKNVEKPDGSFYTAKELQALALDVDVVYQLATPIETPLTPAELAAYKALTTYAPDTVVQASDGAGMEVTYKCNVRKAEKTINDLYAELTAELEA
jgi:hypothetical protein